MAHTNATALTDAIWPSSSIQPKVQEAQTDSVRIYTQWYCRLERREARKSGAAPARRQAQARTMPPAVGYADAHCGGAAA